MSSSGAGEAAGTDEGAEHRPTLQDLLRQADAEAAARERRTTEGSGPCTAVEEPQAHRTQTQRPGSEPADPTEAAEPPDSEPQPPSPQPPSEETITREKRAFAARLGEFRRTAVLVPALDGDLMTATYGGIRWIYAFSDQAALARFAVAAGWEPPPADGLEFLSVYGARLLDVVVPAAGEPMGVALDVADADTGGCVMFPPVLGIVPDEAAVDGENGEALAEAAAAKAVAQDQATGPDNGETTA